MIDSYFFKRKGFNLKSVKLRSKECNKLLKLENMCSLKINY